MSLHSRLTEQLGLEHPIIQAPMAGGDTPALAAAVSEAGGLGSIGAAYLTPERILEAAREVRARTSRPFAINLFAPLETPPPPEATAPALDHAASFYRELGLSAPEAVSAEGFVFEDQLAAALECDAAVLSFTFGVLPESAIQAIRRRGMFLIGTATNVAEAVVLDRAGVHAVVAQGAEAGGHRGTFLGDFASAMVGTAALVPQMADAVDVPVIASGGLMDGRGVVAAFALGAEAVQLGTAFLSCDEAGIPASHREALLSARETGTRVTRAFSGRPARGIVNRFMEATDAVPQAVLPFPYQNALTKPIRAAAKAADRGEFLSLWAGQGLTLARRQSAAELVARVAREAERVAAGLRTAPGAPPHSSG